MTRIAIIGAGYMASEHARAFAAWPGVMIVGVCGRSRERSAALAASCGAPVFENIAELHRHSAADAVVVTVNELSMQAVCEQVFAHPWAVLLEKPVGLDLLQAREIARLAAGHPTWVALNRRAYGATRAALAQLANDAGPRLISVLDQQNMADARAGGQPEAVVRNYMYANSIHLVDYLHTFGRGKLVSLARPVPFNPQQPGHVVAIARFDSGDVGVYQAVWDGPGPWVVAVTDARVRVELRPLERAAVQLRGERRLVELAIDPLDTAYKPGLHRQAGWLLDELSGQQTPLADLAQAVRSTELVAAIYFGGTSDGNDSSQR